MAKVDVKCPFCEQTESVKKHGLGKAGHQRYRCQMCCRTFQLDYAYRACHPGMKEQIVACYEQLRYPRYRTGVAYQYQCCCAHLKKLSPRCVTTQPLDNLQIQLICEVDEMWSFVGNKKQQRWLWYVWEPRLKRIVAHAFGRRSKKTFRKLLKLLVGFNVAFWCTDNFSAYDMLPNEKHITGKLYTQRIERENLNLHNRLKRLNRKTLGYSKSVEMHDKIIGTFIEREYYLQ